MSQASPHSLFFAARFHGLVCLTVPFKANCPTSRKAWEVLTGNIWGHRLVGNRAAVKWLLLLLKIQLFGGKRKLYLTYSNNS